MLAAGQQTNWSVFSEIRRFFSFSVSKSISFSTFRLWAFYCLIITRVFGFCVASEIFSSVTGSKTFLDHKEPLDGSVGFRMFSWLTLSSNESRCRSLFDFNDWPTSAVSTLFVRVNSILQNMSNRFAGFITWKSFLIGHLSWSNSMGFVLMSKLVETISCSFCCIRLLFSSQCLQVYRTFRFRWQWPGLWMHQWKWLMSHGTFFWL